MIQSQGSPAHPRDSSPGRLDRPPSTEPLARWASRSPSTGPAGCLFSKHKAAGECPNPKAAESPACAPASQAQAAGSGRLRAPSTKPLESVPNPKRLDPPAARTSLPSQSGWSRRLRVPRTKLRDWLINGLIACQGPHLQRLPNTCAQSPAGPTGSLGQRQNTQQRGASGLGETAFPGKTRPSRGLNYPIAAPRAPSI